MLDIDDAARAREIATCCHDLTPGKRDYLICPKCGLVAQRAIIGPEKYRTDAEIIRRFRSSTVPDIECIWRKLVA